MKITRNLLFLCATGLAATLSTASLAQETDSNDSPETQSSAPAGSDAPSTPTTAPDSEEPVSPTPPEEAGGESVSSSKPMLMAVLVLLGLAFAYFMVRAGRKVDS